MQVGLVPIPASDEEIQAADLLPPPDAGSWPTVAPRPDLLAPTLSRLLSGDYIEMSLQPGRDGLKATLLTAHGEEQCFPIAPKDALGFLATVFRQAPGGVVRTGLEKPPRVALSVRPAPRHHEYRLRLAAVVPGPEPTSLNDVGLSPALLELMLESLDRTADIILISGGPSSGRSTTLQLLASALAGRGRRGGRIGPRRRKSPRDPCWLAEAVSDWPFPESLYSSAPDFVLIERLESPADLVLAARLASSGRLVLAGAPAADPELLARTAQRDLEAGAAPAVPVTVLGQSLVRCVCRGCVTWTTIPPTRMRRLGFHPRDVEQMERAGGLAVPHGQGCSECAGTGAAGLTGVFEYVGPDETRGSLPRMREEGWRKVVQGLVLLDDVAALAGAHRTMRTLREIMVRAGLTQEPAVRERPGSGVRPGAAARPAPADPRGPRPAAEGGAARRGPAVAEAKALAALLKNTQRGQRADPSALVSLERSIAARGAAQVPLQEMMAPSDGFHLARHGVNTALIAVRLGRHLGLQDEAVRVARTALLHDAGLLRAGVVPDADLPATPSEETLDPSGSRFNPTPILNTLGCKDPSLPGAIAQVHALLSSDPQRGAEPPVREIGPQVVALASLIDLHRHGPGERRPADLHDVPSIVMEKHGRRFSPALFRALLRAIPIFPIGSLVELSSGDLATVVSLNENNHFRPRVEIRVAGGGERVDHRRVVDLARAPFLHIRHRVAGSPAAARAER
ncbi:MAG: hypothetical protein ACE5JG_07845, partial [Planctomycetota bacterium]